MLMKLKEKTSGLEIQLSWRRLVRLFRKLSKWSQKTEIQALPNLFSRSCPSVKLHFFEELGRPLGVARTNFDTIN